MYSKNHTFYFSKFGCNLIISNQHLLNAKDWFNSNWNSSIFESKLGPRFFLMQLIYRKLGLLKPILFL